MKGRLQQYDGTFFGTAKVSRFSNWVDSKETSKIIQVMNPIWFSYDYNKKWFVYYTVTEIEHHAFSSETINEYYYKINDKFSFIYPNSIEKIGEHAFFNNQYLIDVSRQNSSTSQNYSPSLRYIGKECFAYCRELRAVSVPSTIEEIGEGAFYQSGILAFGVPEGNSQRLNIKRNACYDCERLQRIDLPRKRPISIGDDAFSFCTGIATELYLPAGIDSIGRSAFASCTFYGELRLPDSLRYLGTGAFIGCERIYGPIVIPEKLEHIPFRAFKGCKNLSGSITFSKNLITISSEAFEGIGDIKYIISKASNPPSFVLSDDSTYFSKEIFNATLLVPEESIDAYKIADGWKQFSKIQAVKDELKLDSIKIYTNNDINKIIIPPNGSHQLSLKSYPETDNIPIIWYSENKDIADVSHEGLIYGKKEGKTKVWVKSLDGKKDCVEVVVSEPIKSITLGQSECELRIGFTPHYTGRVEFKVDPDNGLSNELIDWSVADKSVCAVEYERVSNRNLLYLYPRSYGKTILTGKAMDGSDINVSCKINVKYSDDVKIKMNENKIDLKYGDKCQLSASISPSYANRNMKWYSSNNRVVTVDSIWYGIGLVKSEGPGEAYVFVKTVDGTEKVDSCLVRTDYGTGIYPKSPVMNIEDELKFRISVFDNVPVKNVQWFVDDNCKESISINDIGLVKILKYTGRSGRIYANVMIKDTCIRFDRTIDIRNYPNRLKISNKCITCNVGESLQFSVTKLPEGTGGDYISWETTNSNIARVDNNGIVKAISPGEVKIYATSYSRTGRHLVYSDTCLVTVQPSRIDQISINPKEWIGQIGESEKLEAVIYPSDAMPQSLEWHSSNESVASVNDNGIVTGISYGTAEISVACGNVSDVCNVTISPFLAKTISLEPTYWSGKPGDFFQINVIKEPADATEDIDWESTDPEIASVYNNGLVQVLNSGECSIIAHTTGGSDLSAECKIVCSSGIEELISNDSDTCDIYSIDGLNIRSGCSEADLKQLTPGIYLIHKNNQIHKIIVR